MAFTVRYVTVALIGLLATQSLAVPNGGKHDHDRDHYYQVDDYEPPKHDKYEPKKVHYVKPEKPKKVKYVKVTYKKPPPPKTTEICCTGTITLETTVVEPGPTYTEGTTVWNEVEYVTYYVTDNATVSTAATTVTDSTYISNPIAPTLPSTAYAPEGWRTINSLELPCTTTKVTKTLKFDPVVNTAVYNRDRVETAFTIEPTPTPTPTPTPEPESIAPPPPPTTTEEAPPPPPTVEVAAGSMVGVSKAMGGLVVAAAVAFVL